MLLKQEEAGGYKHLALWIIYHEPTNHLFLPEMFSNLK